MQPYLITPPRPKGSVKTRFIMSQEIQLHNTHIIMGRMENLTGVRNWGKSNWYLELKSKGGPSCALSIAGCVWPSKFSPSAEKGGIVCLK